MNGANRHRVTLRQVVTLDLAAYLTAVIGGCMAVSLLSLLLFVGWFGGPPPKESPGMILFGSGVAIGIALAFLHHRKRRITDILDQGNIVQAELLRGLAFHTFVQLLVQLPAAQGTIRRKLWLPNTRRPRELVKRESLLIGMPREGFHGALVASLYASQNDYLRRCE